MIIWKFWFLINLTDLQTVKCFHFKVSQFFSNLIFLDPFGHQYWNTAIFWMNIRSNILRLAVCWMDIHREIRFTLPLLALAAAEDLPRLSEDFHKDCKYISRNYSGTWLWEIYESSCRGGQEEEGPRWSGWDAKSEKLCTFSKKFNKHFLLIFKNYVLFWQVLFLKVFTRKWKLGPSWSAKHPLRWFHCVRSRWPPWTWARWGRRRGRWRGRCKPEGVSCLSLSSWSLGTGGAGRRQYT